MHENSSRQVALSAARAALEKKARDVVILTLKDLTIIADYFVICTSTSTTHAKAIVDHLLESVDGSRHVEGYERGRWILVDYGDVVVHVMQDYERKFYELERLWGDAPMERMSSP